MKYHITLELTPEQIRKLKYMAADTNLSIKELVRRAIEAYLTQFKEEE